MLFLYNYTRFSHTTQCSSIPSSKWILIHVRYCIGSHYIKSRLKVAQILMFWNRYMDGSLCFLNGWKNIRMEKYGHYKSGPSHERSKGRTRYYCFVRFLLYEHTIRMAWWICVQMDEKVCVNSIVCVAPIMTSSWTSTATHTPCRQSNKIRGHSHLTRSNDLYNSSKLKELGVVYTMNHEVVPRPCKICDWLLNSSWDYFNLHRGKICYSDHGVRGH